MERLEIPDPPEFSDEIWENCKNSGDYMPIAFEWSKYIGLLANILGSISSNSPGLKDIDGIEFTILQGMLNRCSRLTLSMIHLSVEKSLAKLFKLLSDVLQKLLL